MITIHPYPIDPLAAAMVAVRLRPADQAEVRALTPRDWSIETMCSVTAGLAQAGFVAAFANRPVAVVGARQIRDGIWNVWMWATAEFPRVAAAVTRRILQQLIPELISRGAHRAEAYALSANTKAIGWMCRYLGARAEGRLEAAGSAGEDLTVCAWTFKGLRAAQSRCARKLGERT